MAEKTGPKLAIFNHLVLMSYVGFFNSSFCQIPMCFIVIDDQNAINFICIHVLFLWLSLKETAGKFKSYRFLLFSFVVKLLTAKVLNNYFTYL
jgi:hypothetical protein